jgi:hypothetical protein
VSVLVNAGGVINLARVRFNIGQPGGAIPGGDTEWTIECQKRRKGERGSRMWGVFVVDFRPYAV